jgi:hypothetical protein
MEYGLDEEHGGFFARSVADRTRKNQRGYRGEHKAHTSGACRRSCHEEVLLRNSAKSRYKKSAWPK